MVAVMAVPVQVNPFLVKLGVMVKVTNSGKRPELTSVPEIFPVPDVGIPVTAALVRVHEYTVPATLPLKTMAVMADSEQEV